MRNWESEIEAGVAGAVQERRSRVRNCTKDVHSNGKGKPLWVFPGGK